MTTTPLIASPATTKDVFLKGRLTVDQPKDGFRSGSDGVLLAAAAAGFGFERALDAGCGAGIALLSVHELTRHQGGQLIGLEIDPIMGALARGNVAANHCSNRVDIVEASVLLAPECMHQKFDLIFSNPPFFDDALSIRDPTASRQTAHVLGAPLGEWINGLLAMTARKGRILLVHRAERLGDILAAFQGQAGDIAICPVRARPGEAARRVLVSAKKGSRSPLRLLAGIDLHDRTRPKGFSAAYEAICDGGILSMS